MTAGSIRKSVVVLDYGSGNLRSAQRALERIGADVTVTDDRAAALACDGLVVPGGNPRSSRAHALGSPIERNDVDFEPTR